VGHPPEQIGGADERMDTDPKTEPVSNFLEGHKQVLLDYHFVSPQRDAQLQANFEKSGSISDLGTFLHAHQDTYSHSEQIAKGQYHHNTTAPDHTYTDPAKADRMAMDTFNLLVGAKGRITGNGNAKTDYKKIQGLVHDFNTTSNDKKKYKDLQGIQKIARE